MKYFVLFLLACVAGSYGSEVWGTAFGASSDAQKFDILRRGVIMARNHFWGHPCLAAQFGTGTLITPTTATNVDFWVQWLCTYLHSSAANDTIVTLNDCNYRNEVTNEAEAITAMGAQHGTYQASTAQFTLVAEILASGIEAAGGGVVTRSELLTEFTKPALADAITAAGQAAKDAPCRTPDHTIQWSTSTQSGSVAVSSDEMVLFVWADSLPHSVYEFNDEFRTDGFGGENNIVATGGSCGTDPAVPCDLLSESGSTISSGLQRTSMEYAKIIQAPGVYDMRCNQHPLMKTEIRQDQPIQSSSGIPSDGGSTGTSSSSRQSSWLF
eukprot:TRINITY_DN10304_c0_g1_i1.p1 TRINITY_DN10304_c0_g1~~TRINITY_DN10304_c0_g1_i1.p1  ORF type:complete len:326 (+),score=62.66 TRINITY_DN10304_c0_g1_i1:162-1139(+)